MFFLTHTIHFSRGRSRADCLPDVHWHRSGVFRIRCNVPCGGLHPFKIGELRVGPDTGFFRAIGLVTFSILAAFVASPSHPTVQAA